MVKGLSRLSELSTRYKLSTASFNREQNYLLGGLCILSTTRSRNSQQLFTIYERPTSSRLSRLSATLNALSATLYTHSQKLSTNSQRHSQKLSTHSQRLSTHALRNSQQSLSDTLRNSLQTLAKCFNICQHVAPETNSLITALSKLTSRPQVDRLGAPLSEPALSAACLQWRRDVESPLSSKAVRAATYIPCPEA